MNLSPQYLAGFFDGEGCVRIERVYVKYVRGPNKGKYRSRPVYRLAVKISQARPEVLLLMQQQFNGGCMTHCHGNVTAKRTHAHQLEFRGQRARDFLSVISDYIVIKKAEIELAEVFAVHLDNFDMRGQRKPEILDPVFEERERMYQAMMALKVVESVPYLRLAQ